MTMPIFELEDINLTEKEYQETVNKPTGGKIFTPGVYDVKISKAEWGNQSQKDNTWYSLKLTLTFEQKELKAFVMVPTSRLTFNPDGSKQPLMFFRKLREVFAAIGEDCTVDNVKELIKTYFGNLDNLIGKTIQVKIAYTKPYIQRIGEKQLQILDKDGIPLVFDGQTEAAIYPDRDSAIAEAAVYGFDISKSFPEVVKYFEKEISDSDPFN